MKYDDAINCLNSRIRELTEIKRDAINGEIDVSDERIGQNEVIITSYKLAVRHLETNNDYNNKEENNEENNKKIKTT